MKDDWHGVRHSMLVRYASFHVSSSSTVHGLPQRATCVLTGCSCALLEIEFEELTCWQASQIESWSSRRWLLIDLAQVWGFCKRPANLQTRRIRLKVQCPLVKFSPEHKPSATIFPPTLSPHYDVRSSLSQVLTAAPVLLRDLWWDVTCQYTITRCRWSSCCRAQ